MGGVLLRSVVISYSMAAGWRTSVAPSPWLQQYHLGQFTAFMWRSTILRGGSGGGVYNFGGTLTVTNSTISGNAAC